MAKKPKTLLERWGDASYESEHLWADTQHPIAGLGADVGFYTSIAHRAVLGLQEQVERFLREQGLSVAQINHSEFQESYEHRSTGFREWFEIQCKKYDQDPHADVVLIGPSVKSQASSERKVFDEKGSPDGIRDYLRFAGVVLKTRSAAKAAHKHGQSFDKFERLLIALEGDPRVVAHKNQLWTPHKETGHRSHKSRWIVEDPEDPDYQILAEGKFQHEAQMDVDKLTRPFLSIDRASKRLKSDYRRASTAKRINVAKGEAEARASFVTQLGNMLFDRVHADAGFNARFLDPQSERQGSVPQIWEIDQFIYEGLKLFSPIQQQKLLKDIASSGVLPRSSDFHTAPQSSKN